MATKSLKKLAPSNQQKPGGDAGPGTNINSAKVLMVSNTNLTKGTSSSRGKGK